MTSVSPEPALEGRSQFDEEQIVLGVLDAVDRNSALTQRNVSTELGIALGLANAYLKRCVRKGFIKVTAVPSRRYAYFLTPQGFAEKSRLTARYLAHSFAFFRRARTQCSEIFDTAARRGHLRIAFVGAGDLAEIATLVAREHTAIQFLGVLDPKSEETLGESAQALGAIDAVVVTALDDPFSAYGCAKDLFGSDCVYAPGLLRIHAKASRAEQAS